MAVIPMLTPNAEDWRPWLYCAGKIAPNDWRDHLFGTRDVGGWGDQSRGWNTDEPDAPRFYGRGNGGDHPHWRYAGPFFISCDHGCGHGPASHGCAIGVSEQDLALFNGLGASGGCIFGSWPTPHRGQVLKASLSCIRAADLVFVWIGSDFASAHGTIAEIGYAAALKKPIYAARSPEMATSNLVELWFPLGMTRFVGTQESPEKALRFIAALSRHVETGLDDE
jgi:hypothetical protein